MAELKFKPGDVVRFTKQARMYFQNIVKHCGDTFVVVEKKVLNDGESCKCVSVNSLRTGLPMVKVLDPTKSTNCDTDWLELDSFLTMAHAAIQKGELDEEEI